MNGWKQTIGWLCFLLQVFASSAQVKIGGDPQQIHPHSLLELSSNTKVLIITALTQEEMIKIKPLEGALVFNKDHSCLYFYHHRWIPLCEDSPPIIPPAASFETLSPNHYLFTASNGEQTTLQVAAAHHQHQTSPTAVMSHTHSFNDLTATSHTHNFTNTSVAAHTHAFAELAETTHQHDFSNYALNTHSHETQPTAVSSHTHNFSNTSVTSHTHNFTNTSVAAHTHTLSETTTTQTAALSPLDSINLKNLRDGTLGSLWYSNETGILSEIRNSNLSALSIFWDQEKQRLGIGTTNPSNKLHVAGEIRSQGFSNSNGSQNEPSYSFKSDTNTGMYRAAADQLAFGTKGEERMRLNKQGYLAIGTTAPNSHLTINGSFSLPIIHSSSQTTTLNENHYTLVLHPAAQSIILPPAAESYARIYCIKNLSGHEISSDQPYVGPSEFTSTHEVFLEGITWIQSDGTLWQQIR